MKFYAHSLTEHNFLGNNHKPRPKSVMKIVLLSYHGTDFQL